MMTEYEMADLLVSNSFAAIESFLGFVTIMAAYLVATYFAAQKMSRSQVVLVSLLFSISALLMTWNVYSYMTRAILFADELEVLHPDRFYGAQPWARNIVTVLEVLGVVGSVKFMWDARNPKNE
jgi:hypothetical protein